MLLICAVHGTEKSWPSNHIFDISCLKLCLFVFLIVYVLRREICELFQKSDRAECTIQHVVSILDC
jgi:hypothetical protein